MADEKATAPRGAHRDTTPDDGPQWHVEWVNAKPISDPTPFWQRSLIGVLPTLLLSS